MKYPTVVVQASIVLLASAAAAEAPRSEDYAGLRFRCGSTVSPEICLDVLKPECELRVASERYVDNEGRTEVVIPRQSSEFLLLRCPNVVREVSSLSDLAGHVTIQDAADALEFLRFRSSLWTVGFFDEKEMEVLKAEDRECYASCLPPARWRALGLEPTIVEQAGEGFRVSRNVVRPEPSVLEVTAYRTSLDVLPDGRVQEVSADRLQLESEDQARLIFHLPM